MPKRQIAIGLVGAGRIARLVHLPVLGRMDGCQIAAVADPDPAARAAAEGLAPGAGLFESTEEMLAAGSLDAVVVCAPSGLHASVARAAFGAGLPAYVEKPVAVSLEDGRSVLEAQAGAGTVGMTGFMLRFSPAFAQARELIAAGDRRSGGGAVGLHHPAG
jgi:myo-inositol 2-dehydrogenase/D-chiro-inositol 1-dehydrogenase